MSIATLAVFALCLPAYASYKVEARTLSAQPVVGIERTSSLAEIGSQFTALLPRVRAYVKAKAPGEKGTPFLRFRRLDSEHSVWIGGLILADALPGNGEILAETLPAGRTAVTTHQGASEKVGQAYFAVKNWLLRKEKDAAGPPWEVFLSDPANTPEAKRQTQVFFPMKDKESRAP